MPHRKIDFQTVSPAARTTRSLMLAIYEEVGENAEHLKSYLGEESAAMVMDLLERRHVFGRYKEFNLLSCRGHRDDLDWLLLMGLGKKKDLTPAYRLHDRVRSVAAIAARHFRRKTMDVFGIEDFSNHGVPPEIAGALIAEGVTLGVYRFDRYKKDGGAKFPEEKNTREVQIISSGDLEALQRSALQGQIDSVCTCEARDLVNTRAADQTPEIFARDVKRLADEVPGLNYEMLGKADMEKEQMNLHLEVARGSLNPPCVAILTYTPKGEEAGYDLALVGKGVTFDAGGYNLKPSGYLMGMHGDMGGAASVAASIRAIAERGAKLNVVGVMPLAENLVNGEAYKPGDVIRSRKGLAVEITNTDAEGRLLLADALSYTCDRFKPRQLVDVATLTGNVIQALGHFVTGLFASGATEEEADGFARKLEQLGLQTGEWLWRLPMHDEYKVQLSSSVADLENCDTDRATGAGAITASIFLREFVDFDVVRAWAHLDIAGTSYMERTLIYNKCPYQPKEGATGIGTRLLTQLALELSDSSPRRAQ